MIRQRFPVWLRWVLVMAVVLWGAGQFAYAQSNNGNGNGNGRMRSTTKAQRKAARNRAAPQSKGVNPHFAGLDPSTAALSPLVAGPSTLASMTPGAPPDYFGVANYAN